jgi:GH15 family glucan-1,4-alpha-glucosidase
MSDRTKHHYLPIEDYAVIGDLHTVALVGKNGSIDWCCLPHFAAPSVFAALLDTQKGGFFRIYPSQDSEITHKQIYLPETNILLTTFLADDGAVEITDFMPVKHPGKPVHKHQLVRSVTAIRGTMTLECICQPAFNYARDNHKLELEQSEHDAIFHSSDLHLALASSFPLQRDSNHGVSCQFRLAAGQSVHFLLESIQEDENAPQPLTNQTYTELFTQTRQYWHDWIAQCQYHGRWREMVQRSALVLKLLTYAPTGAIVAAPTTSLPETIGGARNWDYRYTWLRDASFTLYSLLSLGFTDEAHTFMSWLDKRCHELKREQALQPMYGIHGEHEIAESVLDHLEGYRKSSPVHIGNDAYKQTQLDIYGIVMDAIYIYNHHSSISYDLWQQLESLLAWLQSHWQEPDEGIWEVRGGARHFVTSRLMSWVAFDRGIRLIHQRGLPGDIAGWMKQSTTIYRELMEQGWNEERKSFVQHYDTDALDASTLLMALMKFSGSSEPHMAATIQRIQAELASGALVRRYNPDKAANDGQEGQEGFFAACSFWLAETLVEAGHVDEGRLVLEKTLSYSNHVGLYAEEIGPRGEALGNFPQALTHLSLITACYTIDNKLKASPKIFP